MWDGQIKVITGIRRCGKSVLLFELFRDYLLSQGTSAENIITIELDKRKDVKYRSPIALRLRYWIVTADSLRIIRFPGST
jgi:predicted AAA+ superfamily ATPase